eukprot:scaffold82117_cov48-Phaeocystis_antarctica.AAC.1
MAFMSWSNATSATEYTDSSALSQMAATTHTAGAGRSTIRTPSESACRCISLRVPARCTAFGDQSV